jgi:hypothetical protein
MILKWAILTLLTTRVLGVASGQIQRVDKDVQMKYEVIDGGNYSKISKSVCEGVLLQTDQINHQLDVWQLHNVKFLMITTHLIEKCGEFNWVGCPLEATYCKFFEETALVASSKSLEPLLANLPCTSELYLYFFPSDQTQPAQAILSLSDPSGDCSPLQKNPCVSMSYDQCKSPKKDSGCGQVTCILDHYFYKGYCYKDVDQQLAFNLCNQNYKWAASTSKDVEIIQMHSTEQYSYSSYIAVGLIGLLLLVCACSSYYKYQLSQNGFPPFSRPLCCPNCLFPSPDFTEADYASVNNGLIPLRILKK